MMILYLTLMFGWPGKRELILLVPCGPCIKLSGRNIISSISLSIYVFNRSHCLGRHEWKRSTWQSRSHSHRECIGLLYKRLHGKSPLPCSQLGRLFWYVQWLCLHSFGTTRQLRSCCYIHVTPYYYEWVLIPQYHNSKTVFKRLCVFCRLTHSTFLVL